MMIDILKKETRFAKRLLLINILFFIVMALFIGITFSSLQNSKTATGVISFSLPPNVDMTNFNLFITNSGNTYVGDVAVDSQLLTEDTCKTFNMFLTKAVSGDVDSSAYIKLDLIFYGTNAITYNGSSYAFTDKNGDLLSQTLTYLSTSTTNGNVIVSFKSSSAVPQYASIFLDKILSGLSCSQTLSRRVLEIKASTSYQSDFSGSTDSSSIFINYSTASNVEVSTPTNQTNYSLSNIKVNGSSVGDLSQVPFGSTMTFDVVMTAGYDANEPLVTITYGNNVSELSYQSKDNKTYTYSLQVSNSFDISVEPVPNTYTIQFNGNGNTSGTMGNILCEYGKTYTLSSNTFVKAYNITYNQNYSGGTNSTITASCTFNGWTGSNGSSYGNKASISNLTTTNGDIFVMTANWLDASVTLPSPTRDGLSLIGWYNDASGTTLIGAGGENYIVTSNVTLYAKWDTVYSISLIGEYTQYISLSPNVTQASAGMKITVTFDLLNASVNGARIYNVTESSYIYIHASYSAPTENIVYELEMPSSNITIEVFEPICCVSGDTEILMADGTTKRADEVQIGDMVKSYNFESGEIENTKILSTTIVNRIQQITLKFNDGSELKITNDHALFTEFGWKGYNLDATKVTYGAFIDIVGEFEIGDNLFSLSKLFDKEIIDISLEEDVVNLYKMYTFVVENNHNYFSNGVLSHNALPCVGV